MGSFEISKEFAFDYGHRVWTQKLDVEFSLDNACVCRHLHGHRGTVWVHLFGTQLNNQGMITDFKHLNWLKKFVDDTVDHKFIIDMHDPLYNKIVGNKKLVEVYVPKTTYRAGWVLDITDLTAGTPEYEYYDGFFVVDFVPTSEGLSRWMYMIVQNKMAQLGVRVSKVEWWETPKSCSVYTHHASSVYDA